MRLKYSRQLSEIWGKYYENKWMFEEIVKSEDDYSSKTYKKLEQKKYDKAMLVFPTINLLNTLITNFRLKEPVDFVPKDEMFRALEIIKKDIEQSIEGMSSLFNADERITKETEPERVKQIKSVRQSIKNFKKRIEALEWYEDLIKNTNIIEQKFQKLKEDEHVYNQKNLLGDLARTEIKSDV